MRERFGALDPKSTMLRFHTQTGGSTLTAQQPENNIVRTTIQALAATLGGTQSLHTNGFDEALGLPTERAAKLALRTQQVLGFESGIADTVDPLAGSYYVESLTNEVERLAREYIEAIDGRGGAVAAIESHYMQDEIESAAYEFARGVDRGEKVVVGVNRFEESESTKADVFPIDEEQQRAQIARVTSLKQNRDNDGVQAALEDLATAARGSSNVLYPMKTALSRRATLGEVLAQLGGEKAVGHFRCTLPPFFAPIPAAAGAIGGAPPGGPIGRGGIAGIGRGAAGGAPMGPAPRAAPSFAPICIPC